MRKLVLQMAQGWQAGALCLTLVMLHIYILIGSLYTCDHVILRLSCRGVREGGLGYGAMGEQLM